MGRLRRSVAPPALLESGLQPGFYSSEETLHGESAEVESRVNTLGGSCLGFRLLLLQEFRPNRSASRALSVERPLPGIYAVGELRRM
jgi:hypothetical protein